MTGATTGATAGRDAVTTAVYCGYCGKDLAEADHAACAKRLRVIDPPRFCSACARRMVVQVTPTGWTATCSRHGQTTSA